MTKIIYLLFKDGEESKETLPKENTEDIKNNEQKEDKTEVKEDVKETKKETKKSEKKVSITAKEFEEYKQFKLNSMSAEERENTLKEENDSLLTKIGILENTIETQTKEIEKMKAQDSIKEKLNSLKTEKPYLIETLNNREKEGFNSLEDLTKFVSIIDSPTLKEAYEIMQKTKKATKVTGSTFDNVNTTVHNTEHKESKIDLSKYGIKYTK